MSTYAEPIKREDSDLWVKQFTEMGIDGRIDLLLMFYADNKYKSKITEEQRKVLNYVFSNFYPRLMKGGVDGREVDLKDETLGIMIEEGLVHSFMSMGYIDYEPTAKGYRINEKGGWLKHFKEESESIKLDKINKELNIEKLEYEKTIRKLQEELSISSLLRNWWWLIVSAIVLGTAIGKYLLR